MELLRTLCLALLARKITPRHDRSRSLADNTERTLASLRLQAPRNWRHYQKTGNVCTVTRQCLEFGKVLGTQESD